MPRSTPRWTASQLRRDLTLRAAQYARSHSLLHDISTGSDPAVIFGREDEDPTKPARHGNFHPDTYAAICANPDWLRRLAKPHTASRRSRARKDWRWMELDSASSSDALLMNIFCHPEVFDGTHLSAPVARLLNVDPVAVPCFGARPGVPLSTPLKPRTKSAAPRQALDRTEIDLTLLSSGPALFVEAKLTESGFQTAVPKLVERYRDLETVFDVDRLPRKVLYAARMPRQALVSGGAQAPPVRPPHRLTWEVESPTGSPHLSQLHSNEWDVNGSHLPAPDFPDDAFLNLPARPARIHFESYQLIRNVLAAYANEASFCVLCDARRRDLIESWYAVLAAVRSPTFATRLKLLTWQELAVALPAGLQAFLQTKYGIVTANN